MIRYVTRGAFHNPTRDRSQLAGLATVTTPVRTLRRPVQIAGRQFALACNLRIDVVLPERKGIPVAPLVSRLSFIKRKEVWGQYIPVGLIELPAHDLALLGEVLKRSGLPGGATKG